MKTVYVIFLYCWILLLVHACYPKDSENCHYRMYFKNESLIDVYVQGGWGDTVPKDPSTYGRSKTEELSLHTVKSNSNEFIFHTDRSRGCIEGTFKDKETYPNSAYDYDTFNVKIMDASMVHNTSWDTIVKHYMLLKRYDLSLEDLQKLDWTLTYPPTEAMRNIRQWPPYGK